MEARPRVRLPRLRAQLHDPGEGGAQVTPQIVIMLYEDPTKDTSSEERFHVELHFSPGVNCCVQKELPPGPGFRPHSRNHEQVLTAWTYVAFKCCNSYQLAVLPCLTCAVCVEPKNLLRQWHPRELDGQRGE